MKFQHQSINRQRGQSAALSTKLAVIAVGLVAGIFARSASAQTTLLAGFDFQTAGNATATTPNTPTSYTSPFGVDAGTAFLYLDGTHGSSAFAQATELNAFAGTAVNAGTGFSTTTTGAASLALLGGTANTTTTPTTYAANGKTIVFTLSTAGYSNITLSFASQRTGTGFTGNLFSYSLDGTNFTSFSNPAVVPAAAFAVVNEDFSAITAINNQATVYIGYTVNGATSASGNNRLDNIQFAGVAIGTVPEPTTMLGGALIVCAAAWSQRRRLGGLMAA